MQNRKKLDKTSRYWLEILSDAMISVDRNMRISRWNEPAETMFGYPKETAIGKSLSLVIPLEDNISYEQILRLFNTKGMHDRKPIEFKGLKCNGEQFSIEVYIYPAKVKEYFATLVVRDISRLKLIEDEIVRLNRKLLALQRVSISVQKCSNLRDNLKGITEQLVEGSGYTSSCMGVVKGAALQIKALASAGPPNEWERIANIRLEGIRIPMDADENIALRANKEHKIAVAHSIYDVLRPAVSEPICATIQRMSGIKTIACIPLVDDGNFMGNMLVGSTDSDVTEEEINLLKLFAQQAVIAIGKDTSSEGSKESELKSSHRISSKGYSVLFDYADTALAVLREDRGILKVNIKFEKLTGYSKKEVEEKLTLFDFLPNGLKKKMAMKKIKREDLTHYEFEFLCRNGQTRNLAIDVHVIPGTKQSVAVLNDVTEMKKTQSELKAKMNELQEWHKLTIDRELKMVELKRRIKELEEQGRGSGDRPWMLSARKLCLVKER